MPNKSFSIYSAGEDFTIDANDQLVLEVGKFHIAAILSRRNKDAVAAFEMFTFTEDEVVDFTGLFASVVAASKLLGKTTAAAHVYINTDQCLPIPIFKFNKEIAADYLNMVYGEDGFSKIHFEHLAIEPGMMNAFRINEEWLSVINNSLPRVTFHHTYSNVIRKLVGADAIPVAEFISLQFYNISFIVVVMKEDKLQLIQSFAYETPEDVLYHLLNIADRFELYSNELTVQISGMVDVDFKLYRELIKYFKKVVVKNVEVDNLQLNINEHPLHYFTPFFNLAV